MNQGEDTQIKQPLIQKDNLDDQVQIETNQRIIQPKIQNVVKDSSDDRDEEKKTKKRDKSDKEGQDQEEDKAQPVSFMKLISLADTTDKFMMIVGTIAALGAGCVMPMFSFFFGDLTMVYDKPDPIHEALMAAIKFWIIGGAAWILNFFALYCWTGSGQRQALRYRKMYYQLLLKQEVYWYDVNNPNELSTRISTEVTAITGGISQKVANILTVSVTSVLGFFLAYYRNWRLSLVISATLPALMLAGFLVMKAMQIMTDKNVKTYSQAGAVAEQAIGSIRTIKGMVGQLFEIDRYKSKLDESLGSSIKYSMMAGGAIGFMILVFLSTYALGFWYGKEIIKNHHEYNISDVISCFFCIVMGGASLGQAAPALKNIASAKSSAGQFWRLYERAPTLVEPQKGKKIKKIKSVEFKDITFRYKKKDQKQQTNLTNVINGLSLKLERNKVTAIVGQSGSGKSTIVQLLERFYDPDQGSILINDIDLKQLDTKQYRQTIGYVGQEPALFALSIKQNLLFAKEDATEQEMIDALKKANAYDFVMKMEKGLNTFVGTSGTQISGGQKQRIAIARAILKNPQLFIFDEATSALDRVNQKEIQKTLSKLSENITTLVIAHRLSTIQNADNIVVLSKGKIVEQGTHENMVANKSFYYDLVKNQLLVQENNGNQKDNQAQENEELPEIAKAQRKQSQNQIKEVVDGETDKEEQKKKEGAVFSKLIKDSSQNWVWYLVGCFCAIINGVVFPIFSLFLSRLIGLMVQLNDPTKDQEQIQKDINYYCLGFLGVAVLGGVTTFMYHSAFGYIGQKLVYKIRQKVFKKLMRLPVSYYDDSKNNPGSVTTKLAQDAYLIHGMTTGVIGVIILNISTMGTGLFIAFFHHWLLTLIVLGLSPLIALSGALNMKKLKNLTTQSNQAYKEAGNQISDTVTNIRTVKSFGKLNYIKSEFAEKLSQPYQLAKSKAINNGFFQGLSQASIMFVYGLIFYLAAVINEKMEGQRHQTSDIFTAIFAVVFAAVGMGNNTSLMPDMAKGKTAGANLYEILDQKDEYEKSLEQGGVVRENIRGDIEFNNISFKYPSREKRVFKNLNLKIGSLQKTAFVGQSGCGKSTIFQLLLRFYQPDSGQIRIDGRSIKQYDLYYLRSQIGLVLQQPTLFTGTIFDNIRYKNTTATQNDVIEAAKIAQADHFIQKLKDKYESDVGNKGTKLSGGQKQRVALARCILMKPNMFMFDEATSALDTETEKNVFQSLKKVTTGKTSLSIAHRLSTIIDNDQIDVFSEGEVIEQGTYKELVDKGGFFYRLERGQH